MRLSTGKPDGFDRAVSYAFIAVCTVRLFQTDKFSGSQKILGGGNPYVCMWEEPPLTYLSLFC